MKLGRTDRLSPEEREIVDRFERGVIDAEPRPGGCSSPRCKGSISPSRSAQSRCRTASEARRSARARRPRRRRRGRLVEQIARDVYEDPKT